MPLKYHVHVDHAPPRHIPVSKVNAIENKGCLHCTRCVKRASCVNKVFEKHAFDPGQIADAADSLCVGCMRCVQECHKNIISRARNPQYDSMGDEHWKPDIIAKIWEQAQTGKIPVSGAGYRGLFTSPGFDEMWTDMSEIVRPTRDGIHGREYISTSIDLGRRPDHIAFDDNGALLTAMPPLLEIPIPIVLDIPHSSFNGESTRLAMARAAAMLKTFAVAEADEAAGPLAEYQDHLLPRIDSDGDTPADLAGVRIVEIPYSDGFAASLIKVKASRPDIITTVRLPLDENAAGHALTLVEEGAEIIHLQAGMQSRGLGDRQDVFITELMKEVHFHLVDAGVREQVTILLSGGIALAEHAAKIIACGADGVGIDQAMLAALECRLCASCAEMRRCPVEIDNVPVTWGAQRIVNLVGAWHSQLIEVLGAMGIREVRRLRGELGRTMFFGDLEQESFAPLFGNRSVPGAEQGESDPAGISDAIDREPKSTGEEDLSAPCPSRHRNHLGKYLVLRSTACIACGKCAEICPMDVHGKSGGRMLPPKSHLCQGPSACREADTYCVDHCPVHALRIGIDPIWETFGDPRWPSDLLASTWSQAENGRPPGDGPEHRIGASGGGFDRMRLAFPDRPAGEESGTDAIDLSIPLNRRGDGRPEVTIGIPFYGGGMSYGSISVTTMVARAKAYKAFNSFTCTGEGGYPDALKEYDDHVITQVATGLFGVLEETIQRVRIVEFKYAQGAKPGLGGHLLGDKVTPKVAKMREAVEGSSLFSPFPFHSVYSVEDHKKHVDWIKAINPKALVSVKVSTPTDVDMVAVGSYHAGAHIIHLDGSYGGTGAAPDIAKKNIAMPIEYAVPKVHQFLQQEGIRDEMTLIASGGLRTPWDVAKAIALGADGVVIGTAELIALECIRCGTCESGRGCPRGIATTDIDLSMLFDLEWATQRIINLFNAWTIQIMGILRRFGMRSTRELVGRTDLLMHLDYDNNP